MASDEKTGWVEYGEMDHEDYIVGDSTGLQRLRQAVDSALAEGEYESDDLGEFRGVKLLETEFFTEREVPTESSVGGLACATVFVLIAVIFCVGVYVTAAEIWAFFSR